MTSEKVNEDELRPEAVDDDGLSCEKEARLESEEENGHMSESSESDSEGEFYDDVDEHHSDGNDISEMDVDGRDDMESDSEDMYVNAVQPEIDVEEQPERSEQGASSTLTGSAAQVDTASISAC